MATIPSLAQAIGTFEGINVPNSLAQQNANPGNLVYSPWEDAYGATPYGAGGFATFPDLQSGYAALQQRLTQLVNSGATLSDIVNTWAGPQYPGNTQQSATNYLNFLQQQTGLNPDIPVASQLETNTQNASILGGVSGLLNIGSVTSSLFERVTTGLIGLICIAGAFYLYKPTQQIITNTISKGVKAGTTVAALG